MTREEAIQVLQEKIDDIPLFKDEREAFESAIEALSQPIVAKHFDIQSGYIYCSPQIAENVKVVVRCKDCKHHEKFLFDDSKLLCWVHDIDIVVSPTDYCSYAEREVKE